MSDLSDKRSDTTRDQILRAAAHQFAQRPYYAVGLDDILARSAIDQGRNVFPFPVEARAGVGHRRRADRQILRVGPKLARPEVIRAGNPYRRLPT